MILGRLGALWRRGAAEAPASAPAPGGFFPPEYKSFPFSAGDLLVSESSAGLFSVNRILAVDRIVYAPGGVIDIQGQAFTVPVADWLLVVSASFGRDEFPTFEAARSAALAGRWRVHMAHCANRAPGAMLGQVLVGTKPVTEAELEGYRLWRAAFDKGEAGIY